MHLRLRLVTLLAIVAGTVVSAGQQAETQQTPTFKVQVDYVEVDVLVTDQRGNYVRDLKKEDFQVSEDGKPQQIASFVSVDVPVEHEPPLFTGTPIDPDVWSNERPFAGRVYVAVLDSAHTLPQNTNLMRLAAKAFINDKLGANDLMAIVFAHGTAGGPDAGQAFTNNKRLLTASVDRFIGAQPQSATLNKIDDAINHAPMRAATVAKGGTPPELADADATNRQINATAALDELTAVADWFSVVHGRKKSILYFSEGVGPVADASSGRALLEVHMQDLRRAATKANASVYAIDPRGMTGLSDASIELQSLPPGLGVTETLDERALRTESRQAREGLQAVAAETGGFAVYNTNLAKAYDRIVSENSSYYVLAYYPPNPKRDGKYHDISVRVTRPGLNVRFRKGYANPAGTAPVAPKTDVAPELLDALRSPIPVSGLGMRVFAVPFEGTAPNASVLVGVELRGRDLKPAPNSKLELSFVAADAHGSVATSNETLTMNFKPDTQARVEQTGVRELKRLDLKPGRYQLHVAAYDSGSGSAGSVIYELEVPDYSRVALGMSGLALTSPTASATMTVKPDQDLLQVLPGPPTAKRSFLQNEEIALFADVYDHDTAPPHKVNITTTLTADDGRVVAKEDEERSSDELGGKRRGYAVARRIPLKDVGPGSYVLSVEARSLAGAGETARRDLRITIEPAAR